MISTITTIAMSMAVIGFGVGSLRGRFGPQGGMNTLFTMGFLTWATAVLTLIARGSADTTLVLMATALLAAMLILLICTAAAAAMKRTRKTTRMSLAVLSIEAGAMSSMMVAAAVSNIEWAGTTTLAVEVGEKEGTTTRIVRETSEASAWVLGIATLVMANIVIAQWIARTRNRTAKPTEIVL